MEERYVNCVQCGSNDFEVLFEKGKAQVHRIVKCRSCNLMYANPQTDNVTNVEKKHLNPIQVNPDQDPDLSWFTPEDHQYLRKQFLQLRDYARIIDFVEKKDKGIFLEIGSYAGIFLNEAKKRGWDVIGIEPLEIPALYAEKQYGIKVIRKYFDHSGLADGSIDVIASCHVIEHVPNPADFVRKSFSLLKPSGIMVIETPAYDSITFKILKHRERSMRCDGHLFFFTTRTLKKLVESQGFKVLKIEKTGRTLTLDRLFTNLGIITGKKSFFSGLSKKLKLDKFVVSINVGDMQRIYCVKEQNTITRVD
jgi:2-polyprenyl-3-methyl-5-hydroxy-6-metoxy-1,4-benzoquinol methylase